MFGLMVLVLNFVMVVFWCKVFYYLIEKWIIGKLIILIIVKI